MEAARKNAQEADLSSHVEVSALPASLDWREKTPSVVTKVKDQGGCGGCWSFSAAETLESNVAINTGKLMIFSEQEILACTVSSCRRQPSEGGRRGRGSRPPVVRHACNASSPDRRKTRPTPPPPLPTHAPIRLSPLQPNPNQCGGTGGCSGATQELAFAYIQTAGITTEEQWPYTMQSGKCDWTGKTPVANVTGWAALPFNNYSALMNAVVSIGPIAISAAAEPWQSYDSGVFSSPCGADVDHAIVLEGYGKDTKSGLDYYLVRNSWSAGWGEQASTTDRTRPPPATATLSPLQYSGALTPCRATSAWRATATRPRASRA